MAAAVRPRQYRIWTLQAVLVLWGVAVIARLFWLQVVDYNWLIHKAEHQQQRTQPLEAQRGEIYDRNMHPLAMSMTVSSVCADPAEIGDPKEAAAELAAILHLDKAELAARLSNGREFAWIARQVTDEQAAQVRALDLQGICFSPELRRFYPKGSLAANLLGYVNLDGKGMSGVELAYDSQLRGHDGQALIEVDAHKAGYDQVEEQPQPGKNLVLTLDQNIQYVLQTELAAQVASTHATRGVGIVENPQNGEILALAVVPTFNPNDYRETPIARLGDPAVSDPYEPGSVFKLVTFAAALQENLTRPDELIDCQEGQIRVGGRIIHDHQPFGTITATEVLQHSSDVGSIKIGLRLGDQKMYQYMQAFGFGEPTGIGLPGESRGLARPPRMWTPMSIGAISIGQEVAATPVQMMAMFSTLANGGVYHRPRIVLDPTNPTDEGRRVISPEVANELKQMMAQVVLAGTGTNAQLNGYTAAGKTGTAQKVDPGTHIYSADHYVASFAGFAPINDPAIAALIVMDSPEDGHEGGPTAGPVFKRIAEQILPYMGVSHDVPALTHAVTAQNARPQSATPGQADKVEESERFFNAAAEAAPASNKLATSSTNGQTQGLVVLDYSQEGGGVVAMPDFAGKSVRTVSGMCQKLGLDPVLIGTGVARQQSPAAGQHLTQGAKVVVQFGY